MKTNLLAFSRKINKTLVVLLVTLFSYGEMNAQSYCSSTTNYNNCNGNNYSYPFFVGAVRLNTMNNKTTQTCPDGSKSGYYEFVKGSTTTLTQGSTYTIEIDNVLNWTSASNWPVTALAWIDLDGDYTFSKSEALASSSSIIYTSTPSKASTTKYTFTVPCSSVTGTVRLRVKASYSSVINSGQACGGTTSGWGGTKDFDITIAAGNVNPVADFILPSGTVYEQSPAFFTNSNQAGYTNEWLVDEKNNGNFVSVSKSTNLNYAFASSGTKQLRLISTNCKGSATTTKTVYVTSPVSAPTPKFVASNTKIEVKPGTLYGGDVDIFIYDLSTEGPANWDWTFTSQEPNEFAYFIEYYSQNPLFITLDTGTYSICLDVSNKIGTNQLCKQDYISINYPDASAVGNKFENWSCRETSCTLDSGVLYDTKGPSIETATNQFCQFSIGGCEVKDITLTLAEVQLGYYDYLTIYDGVNAKGEIIGSYRYGSTPPSETLKAVSGNVYVEYVTGAYSYNYSGFKLIWKSNYVIDGGPKANFNIPKAGGTDTVFSCKMGSGNAINFTNLSTGSQKFISYEWIFDYSPNITYPIGFNNSKVANPTYTFTTTNKTYNVRLVVESCEGRDTIVKSFVLATTTKLPVVDFVANNTILFPNGVANISNNTIAGCSGKWSISPSTGWQYSSGNSTANNISVKFINKGRYTITREETNDNGTKSLTKSEYIEVIEYCTPSSAFFSTEAGISHVKFAGIDNISGSGIQAYEDYTALGTFEIVMGKVYQLNISRSGATDNIDRKVWIDYNRNGVFESTEIVASETNTSNATLSQQITIPALANSIAGEMRMRIGVTLTGLKLDPCGPLKVGEFEDYMLNLVPDNSTPLLTMIGVNPYEMELGQKYTEYGATAIDNIEGDISNTIITDNQVDENQAGIYYVNYSVMDKSGNKAETKRTVIIKTDMTKPVITINGGNTMTHEVNTPFIEPTASVLDNPGNTSINYHIAQNNVNINKLGLYDVIYEATDAYGNTSTETLIVEVKDQTAPDFHLNSMDPYNIEIGTNFTDPTTVTDNYDNPSDIKITTTGILNTQIAGEYIKTYKAVDLSGNSKTLSRKFNVGDYTLPVIHTLSGTEKMVVEVNSIFNEPKVTATDNSGAASLSKNNGGFDIRKLGSYTIVYTATDASSNVSTYSRTIDVVDTKKPVILDLPIKVQQWANFDATDFNQISVQDNYYSGSDFNNAQNDCKIILVSSDVKTSDPGIYYACYQAIDGSGNISDLNCLTVKVSSNTAGIDDALFANSINVYPNPSQAEFNINFNNGVTNKVKISVVNMLGEVIYTYQYQDINGNKLSIDLGNYAAGIYMLNIEDHNSVATKKITLTK